MDLFDYLLTRSLLEETFVCSLFVKNTEFIKKPIPIPIFLAFIVVYTKYQIPSRISFESLTYLEQFLFIAIIVKTIPPDMYLSLP